MKEETILPGVAPTVTIGLPTFNRPDGLRKVLESILRQTYSSLHILISDNASTDERVSAIISEFAARDKRIRSFRQSENLGLEGNFNFLYAQATTSYFMWMSDDDLFEDNYVEDCLLFLEQNPDYILCSGKAAYYEGDKFAFDEKMFSVENASPMSRVFRYFSHVGKNGNFYGVFRYGLLQRQPLDVHPGCDWSFMAKLALLGKLKFLPSTTYHRSAEGNSGTRKRMVRKFKLNRFKNIFFETYLAHSIATHIFNEPAVHSRFGALKRTWITSIVFVQINYKLLKNFIRKKLGMRVN